VSGPAGTIDPNIRFLPGPADAGFGAPFTPSDFASARTGSPARLTTPATTWITALNFDTTAHWINTSGNDATGGSGLFAIDFYLPPTVDSVSLNLRFAVDNYLGDGNHPGVYVNGTAVPGTLQVGNFIEENGVARDITPLVTPGLNTLYLYVHDFGASAGLLFSAIVDVVSPTFATPPPQRVAFRTGNSGSGAGSADTLVHVLVGPADSGFPGAFTPADFAEARTGPPARLVTGNPAWLAGLAFDPSAKWINDTGVSASGASCLYALDFNLPPGFGYALLLLNFAVDNALGTGDMPGLYLNGLPLPACSPVGDLITEHSYMAEVTSLVTPGPNTLYVYQCDGGSDAGLLMSGEVRMYAANMGVAPTGLSRAPDALLAWPNPFATHTTIAHVATRREQTVTRVRDIAGRNVRLLNAGPLEPGPHTFTWDGVDDAGQRAPAGVYFVDVRSGNVSRSTRVVFMP
jgi:hypothetical protein